MRRTSPAGSIVKTSLVGFEASMVTDGLGEVSNDPTICGTKSRSLILPLWDTQHHRQSRIYTRFFGFLFNFSLDGFCRIHKNIIIVCIAINNRYNCSDSNTF